jgi:hypothetical protein
MEQSPVQILTVAKIARISLHVMEPETYDHVHKILSLLHSLNLMSRVSTLSD